MRHSARNFLHQLVRSFYFAALTSCEGLILQLLQRPKLHPRVYTRTDQWGHVEHHDCIRREFLPRFKHDDVGPKCWIRMTDS